MAAVSSKFLAHILSDKSRTDDIVPNENVDFAALRLSRNVMAGLARAGFARPSPIQLKALPLAKCGLDLICQAKSGTGKTCVFAIMALESVHVNLAGVQVLVIAPTREIAVQIKEVICEIGFEFLNLQCHTFIGGVPCAQDIENAKLCHIAVGTPGRLKYLIENGYLLTSAVRLFVLDEADKLLEDGLQREINWIFSTLPAHKQVLALSATYPAELALHLRNYMLEPAYVRVSEDDLNLKGIQQYFITTAFHQTPQKVFEAKAEWLIKLLAKIRFQQCIVFSNLQFRADFLNQLLNKFGWPSTFISGSQSQEARQVAMKQLKDFQCRVLISTDLIARGVDCEKVNLVINFDLPWDSETYLHRVGRSGRFGSYGLAISILSGEEEITKLQSISAAIKKTILPLPDDLGQLLQRTYIETLRDEKRALCVDAPDNTPEKINSAFERNVMESSAWFSSSVGLNEVALPLVMEGIAKQQKDAGQLDEHDKAAYDIAHCSAGYELPSAQGECSFFETSRSSSDLTTDNGSLEAFASPVISECSSLDLIGSEFAGPPARFAGPPGGFACPPAGLVGPPAGFASSSETQGEAYFVATCCPATASAYQNKQVKNESDPCVKTGFGSEVQMSAATLGQIPLFLSLFNTASQKKVVSLASIKKGLATVSQSESVRTVQAGSSLKASAAQPEMLTSQSHRRSTSPQVSSGDLEHSLEQKKSTEECSGFLRDMPSVPSGTSDCRALKSGEVSGVSPRLEDATCGDCFCQDSSGQLPGVEEFSRLLAAFVDLNADNCSLLSAGTDLEYQAACASDVSRESAVVTGPVGRKVPSEPLYVKAYTVTSGVGTVQSSMRVGGRHLDTNSSIVSVEAGEAAPMEVSITKLGDFDGASWDQRATTPGSDRSDQSRSSVTSASSVYGELCPKILRESDSNLYENESETSCLWDQARFVNSWYQAYFKHVSLLHSHVLACRRARKKITNGLG